MALSDGATVGAALRVGKARVPIIGSARVYVCGITPYDTTHLGHAATFVWTDLVARVLHLTGAHVDVCRNVTDVDDHLLAESRSRGVPWRSLATQQTYRFERDASDLGIVRPAFEPRSHDYVDDVIGLALGLIARGAAYERDGSVYFRGEHVCEAAGLDPTEAVSRLAEDSARHDIPLNEMSGSPLDVAIWQRSSGDEPAWPGPWGEGRPGWHAECAAMALSTFGPTVDVHGGGADLEFPHHAYEAALAEAFTGVSPFARSWMHVGTVKVRGQKMAKSTGNLVLVHDLLQRWPAAAIRYLILARPWRDDWEFQEHSLEQASAHLDDMWSRATNTVDSGTARRQVVAALLDDVDTSRALDIAREAGGQVLTELIDLLGLRVTTTLY